MKKLTTLPKWFNGTIYDKGETVTNPFSGEKYKLTNLELSMYDFIMGAVMVVEMQPNSSTQLIRDLRKGLDWFRKNNAEAYMILLD